MKAERFTVERGNLTRRVTPVSGDPYTHRCPLDSYEEVAFTIDEIGEPITIDRIRDHSGLPYTRVAVALAFMHERGCIVGTHGSRRVAPGNRNGVHLDAMLEVSALREKAS